MAKKEGSQRRKAVATGGDSDDDEGPLVMETGGDDGPSGGTKDISAIRKEVASMLGELGLAAAAGLSTDGFDDRDFRPPPKKEAKKEKAEKKAGTDKQRPADEPQQPPKAAKKGRREEVEEEEEPQEQRGSGKRKRDWNVGAGPAPEPLVPPKQYVKLAGVNVPVREEEKEKRTTGIWWQDAASLPPPKAAAPGGKPKRNGVASGPVDEASLREEAKAVVARAEATAERAAGRNAAWLKLVRRSGTAQDRVAASVVQVQGNVLGNLRALDTLLDLTDSARSAGGKRGAGQALDALRELFSDWLLPDRKLRSFDQQPLASLASDAPSVRAERLGYYFLEDAIKTRYERFVTQLEVMTRDPLEWLKDRAVKAAYEMLSSKPEAERMLLNCLINKLGDPNRKTASNAAFNLQRLLQDHPVMKGVVVRDVGHFAFRPRIGLRAQYTAVTFLSQITLSHKGNDPAVALTMVELYFDLFRVLLAQGPQADGGAGDASFKGKGLHASGKPLGAKKGRHDAQRRDGEKKRRAKEQAAADGARAAPPAAASLSVDSRLLSALLTGINRAFPFVDSDKVDSLVERVSPDIFRIAHAQSLHGAVQALTLLFQMMTARSATSDRFYRALYENPGLTRSSSSAMFLSLLYKALKADVNGKRTAAMCKRALQVSLSSPPAFACGTLLLLSELLKHQPALWTAILQPEDAEDDEKFTDAPLVDDDEMDAREEGDERGSRGTSGKKGAMKNGKVKPGKAASRAAEAGNGNDEEEEEDGDGGKLDARFRFGEDDGPSGAASTAVVAGAKAGVNGGGGGEAADSAARGWIASAGYDMHKREPQFAKGERSCWWELVALSRHMHPSPAAMARTLLAGANVVYAGDPLADLGLTAFLDRWLQKKVTGPKTQSKMQRQGPEAGGAEGGGGGGGGKAAPGSAEFASLLEEDVDPADVFFHRYFSAKEERQRRAREERRAGAKKGKGRGGDDSDESAGEDDDDIDPEWARRTARAADRSGGDVGAADDFGSSDEEEDAAIDAALEEAEAGLGDGALDGEDDAAALLAAAADDHSGGEDGHSDDSAGGFSDSDGEGAEGSDDDDEDAGGRGGKKRRGAAGASAFASADDFEDALEAGGLDETRARRLGLLAQKRGRVGGGDDDEEEEEEEGDEEGDDDDDEDAAALGFGGDGGSEDDGEEEEEEERPKRKKGGGQAAAAGGGNKRRGAAAAAAGKNSGGGKKAGGASGRGGGGAVPPAAKRKRRQ